MTEKPLSKFEQQRALGPGGIARQYGSAQVAPIAPRRQEECPECERLRGENADLRAKLARALQSVNAQAVNTGKQSTVNTAPPADVNAQAAPKPARADMAAYMRARRAAAKTKRTAPPR